MQFTDILSVQITPLLYFKLVKLIAETQPNRLQASLYGVYRKNTIQITNVIPILQNKDEEPDLKSQNFLSKFNLDSKKVGLFSTCYKKNYSQIKGPAQQFVSSVVPQTVLTIMVWDQVDAVRGVSQPLKAYYLFKQISEKPFQWKQLEIRQTSWPLESAFLQQYKSQLYGRIQDRCFVQNQKVLISELRLLREKLQLKKQDEQNQRKQVCKNDLMKIVQSLQEGISMQKQI